MKLLHFSLGPAREDIKASGGLISQLQGGNLEIAFDDAQLGRLIRYMSQHRRRGFQGRCRRYFGACCLRLSELNSGLESGRRACPRKKPLKQIGAA